MFSCTNPRVMIPSMLHFLERSLKIMELPLDFTMHPKNSFASRTRDSQSKILFVYDYYKKCIEMTSQGSQSMVNTAWDNGLELSGNKPLYQTMLTKICDIRHILNQQQLFYCSSEWVIMFNGLFGKADIGVRVVHTSHVIITYTL